MPFFNQLHEKTQPQRQDFLSIPVLQDGITGDISFETYIAFLTQAYHHVKRTYSDPLAIGSLGTAIPIRLF